MGMSLMEQDASDLVSEINMLDYNPDDIDQINVNELLSMNTTPLPLPLHGTPLNFPRN